MAPVKGYGPRWDCDDRMLEEHAMKQQGSNLMGLGLLVALVAGVLLFAGPKDEAGHVVSWWYALPGAAVVLWLLGQRQARG